MQRLWLLSEGLDIVGGILGSSEVVLWVVGLAGWLVFRGQEMCRWSGFRPEASASRLRLYDVVFSPAQIHRLTAVTATTKWENASWIKANRLKCWGVIIQAQMEPSTWPDDHRPFFKTLLYTFVCKSAYICAFNYSNWEMNRLFFSTKAHLFGPLRRGRSCRQNTIEEELAVIYPSNTAHWSSPCVKVFTGEEKWENVRKWLSDCEGRKWDPHEKQAQTTETNRTKHHIDNEVFDSVKHPSLI